MLEQYGKGAAELEMLEWAIREIELLDEDVIIKATGRYIPIGVHAALADLPGGEFVRCRLTPDLSWMDPRLFAMPTGVFRGWFAGCAAEMSEPDSLIEHVFARRLLLALGSGKVAFSRFPAAPRIKGVSGTTGMRHDGVKWHVHQAIESGWRRFAPSNALWISVSRACPTERRAALLT